MFHVYELLMDSRPLNVNLSFNIFPRNAMDIFTWIIKKNSLGLRCFFHTILMIRLKFRIICLENFKSNELLNNFLWQFNTIFDLLIISLSKIFDSYEFDNSYDLLDEFSFQLIATNEIHANACHETNQVYNMLKDELFIMFDN